MEPQFHPIKSFVVVSVTDVDTVVKNCTASARIRTRVLWFTRSVLYRMSKREFRPAESVSSDWLVQTPVTYVCLKREHVGIAIHLSADQTEGAREGDVISEALGEFISLSHTML